MKERREGASLSRTDLRDQYRAWLAHHRLSAAESLLRVLDKPVASLLTWLVIGIALALPAGLSVALDNVGQVSANWDSPAQISLFLEDSVSGERAEALAAEVAASKQVATTRFVSAQDALAEFKTLSGFADVLDSLEENPLPHLILVTPQARLGEAAVAALRLELVQTQGVAEAVLDMAWLQRLNSLMELSRQVVLTVGALLVLGVLLILGNTIRLAIENRRDEIVIVKLVGGSNAFVRRPFLYTGLWYGVGGGAAAAVLVAASIWFLQAPVGRLALHYDSTFVLQGPGIMGALNLLILGGFLGLVGAWMAVGRHLALIEPR
jgi:cell division transport system permease protein